MAVTALARSPVSSRDPRCPVAAAAELIADPWTLLIVREAFGGAQRFDAFRDALPIATNILSARLAVLVDGGILQRTPYQNRPVRYEYALTAKGRDLLPVLRAVFAWGERWTEARGRRTVVHDGCGGRVRSTLSCERCDAPVEATAVKLARRPDAILGL